MTAAERLDRAAELVEQATAEIEDAAEHTDAWALDSLRLLCAELKVSRRRIGNVRKVVGTGSRAA